MKYIEAIGVGFPGVECHSMGDGSVYEDIVWDGGVDLPSKETLDAWIAANNTTIATAYITAYAFRQRFTTAEKIAIEFATLDNPQATTEQRMQAVMLRVQMDDIHMARYIDVTNESLITGMHMLETVGLLAPGRANEILNAPITTAELYYPL